MCSLLKRYRSWACTVFRLLKFYVNLTTTGGGAWGLPEDIRENWGPGKHLTIACLPFLQGVGLRGIDS